MVVTNKESLFLDIVFYYVWAIKPVLMPLMTFDLNRFFFDLHKNMHLKSLILNRWYFDQFLLALLCFVLFCFSKHLFLGGNRRNRFVLISLTRLFLNQIFHWLLLCFSKASFLGGKRVPFCPWSWFRPFFWPIFYWLYFIFQ